MKSFVISTTDERIDFLKKKDKRLGKVINAIGPIECSVHSDSFEFIVSQIVGQMLSNKVAHIIFNRLKALCEEDICATKLLNLEWEELKQIGLSNSKCEYIKGFSMAVKEKTICLEELYKKDDEEVIKELTSIRGIGKWTAKMYLLFVLDRQDILPIEDGAFLQSYKWLYKTDDISKISIEKKCKKWKPYSSVAARYLYRALDIGMTKREIHLYKDLLYGEAEYEQ